MKKLIINKKRLKQIQKDFKSCKINEKETIITMQKIFHDKNIIVDPHTAIGIAAGKKINSINDPIIYIATAHPSKFPEIVKKAIKKEPYLPKKQRSIYKMKEKYKIIDLNYNKIKNYLIKESQFVENV